MTLDGTLFSQTFLWTLNLLLGLLLWSAVRMAPWGRLRNREQLHVFLGTVVALLLLWHMGARVQPGIGYHLLGLTAVTLMFGWSLATIAATLALLGVTLNGGGDWGGLSLNAMVSGVVPITLTQVLLILIRAYLPKQFFVYVLVNGFLTAGLVAAAAGYLATWLLAATGAYTYAELDQTLVPFFPLMFMPEAMLNGWLITILVAFKPHWVYSFSDEQYLRGK
jgi:uncharacterized membrane protein